MKKYIAGAFLLLIALALGAWLFNSRKRAGALSHAMKALDEAKEAEIEKIEQARAEADEAEAELGVAVEAIKAIKKRAERSGNQTVADLLGSWDSRTSD